MRIDRRFAILVGLSLLWAALVSAIFYRVMARPGGRRTEQVEKPMVVAVQSLQFGVIIQPESIKVVRIPANLFPKGGFSRSEEVLDRTVVSPIEPDEPVGEARIAPPGSGVGG